MINEKKFQFNTTWKPTLFVLVWLILVTLGLSACVTQAGADQPRATEPGESDVRGSEEILLVNKKWKLISFGPPGVETPVIEDAIVTLEFDTEGQASGTGGCNTYSSRYDVLENGISFNNITRTMIACRREEITQQEQSYLLALETANDFDLSEDRLTIWYGDGRGVLNFVKSEFSQPVSK